MTDKTMPDEIHAGMNCHGLTYWSSHEIQAAGKLDGQDAKGFEQSSYTRTDIVTALREENARYRDALEYADRMIQSHVKIEANSLQHQQIQKALGEKA